MKPLYLLILSLNIVITLQLSCYVSDLFDEDEHEVKDDCDYCSWHYRGDLRDDGPTIDQRCNSGTLDASIEEGSCTGTLTTDLPTSITMYSLDMFCKTDKCNENGCFEKKEDDDDSKSVAVTSGIGVLMMAMALVI
uniref:UPAR/Ly6 domain-containing protein n=1 Tax=Panagrellus redivivus TaxID=6233 RepID=A0A7E4ZPZ6_PANRE